MYKRYPTELKVSPELKKIILSHISLQHKMWNWLVENYNPIMLDIINKKENWPSASKIGDYAVKQAFQKEIDETHAGYRIYRG